MVSASLIIGNFKATKFGFMGLLLAGCWLNAFIECLDLLFKYIDLDNTLDIQYILLLQNQLLL